MFRRLLVPVIFLVAFALVAFGYFLISLLPPEYLLGRRNSWVEFFGCALISMGGLLAVTATIWADLLRQHFNRR